MLGRIESVGRIVEHPWRLCVAQRLKFIVVNETLAEGVTQKVTVIDLNSGPSVLPVVDYVPCVFIWTTVWVGGQLAFIGQVVRLDLNQSVMLVDKVLESAVTDF